jgi:hypothetical protein
MMCRFRLRKVAEHRAFNNIMMLAILASTVMLAMEYDGMSSTGCYALPHPAMKSALLVVTGHKKQHSDHSSCGAVLSVESSCFRAVAIKQ